MDRGCPVSRLRRRHFAESNENAPQINEFFAVQTKSSDRGSAHCGHSQDHDSAPAPRKMLCPGVLPRIEEPDPFAGFKVDTESRSRFEPVTSPAREGKVRFFVASAT